MSDFFARITGLTLLDPGAGNHPRQILIEGQGELRLVAIELDHPGKDLHPGERLVEGGVGDTAGSGLGAKLDQPAIEVGWWVGRLRQR